MLLSLLLACAPQDSFTIDGGRFLALRPDSLPAPALVFAHGWRSRPEKIVEADPDELQALLDAGIMVLLPEAEADGEWNVQFSPDERDDMVFIDAMLDEADAQWGVTAGQVWGAGFSEGGSVAHHMGCYRSERFAGIVPLSGTFWEPMPADCGDATQPVRHVHGTTDGMWPPEGRQFSETTAQGNIYEGVAMWRAQNGCTEETEAFTDGPLSCTRWLGCTGGAVELCLHDGAHVRRSGWGARAHVWLTAQAR